MSEGNPVVELAKRRGFFLQSAGAYGGVSGFYTFGPEGAALKQNIEDTWRERFTIQEGNMEVDAPTVMPEPVFEASGHLDGFDDMLIECPDCGESTAIGIYGGELRSYGLCWSWACDAFHKFRRDRDQEADDDQDDLEDEQPVQTGLQYFGGDA